MDCFLFRQPPEEDTYRQLVAYCCAVSVRMTLVVRDPDLAPGAGVRAILGRLEGHLLGQSLTSSWPGTVLFSDKATVFTYAVSEELSRALIEIESSLFSWVHPDAPEDLCFYRKDGSSILVTISHEEDAYMLLTSEELAGLRARFDALAYSLKPENE